MAESEEIKERFNISRLAVAHNIQIIVPAKLFPHVLQIRI